jgi:hypothetical protein
MELTFRLAHPDEITIVLQLLREAALWLREKQIDYWQDWLDPPPAFVHWIQKGFQQGEFYLVYSGGDLIGCFRLMWKDEAFWGERREPAGYIHSFTTVLKVAGERWGERILAMMEAHCAGMGKEYLRLDCGSRIENLCAYYEANGFRKAGTTIVRGEELTLYEKRIQ